MADHTPTPWRLKTTGNLGCAIEADCGGRYDDSLDDGFRVVATYQECCASNLYAVQEANRNANGAFIVKAVNSHDALVAALIKAKTCLLDGCLPWVRHNGPREGTTHGRIDETVAAIDSALQEAGR